MEVPKACPQANFADQRPGDSLKAAAAGQFQRGEIQTDKHGREK